MKRLIFVMFLAMYLLISGKDSTGQVSVYKNDTADYPYWVKMMQDPAANFFSTVSAFNKYWENRPDRRSRGWKVFKRWEYIMQSRISSDGTKPAPDKVYKAWQTYFSGNRSLSGNWTSLGPSTIPSPGPAGYLGLGRLNVIAFHPTDQNKIYVGSPSGGFWLSDDNGSTWNTTTDALPTIGVSALAVDYSYPAKILMGTGDRDHGDAPGMGIFISTDNGLTWAPSNSGMGNTTVCRIIQHPTNSAIYLTATTNGIYRSTNGGNSWTRTFTADSKDICFHPANPNIVYIEANSNFYRSTDNGLTFSEITSGLTSGQRGAIAVTPANPNVVYFVQSDNSSGFKCVYRSADAGLSFSVRSTTPNILDWSCDGSGSGGQGWYDLAIVADPANANVIYVGGIDIWKSTDGGVNWTKKTSWAGGCDLPAVHADCHYLGYSPVTGRLYTGNDGGIYYSDDGGTNWTDCTVGMTIGQIYKIGQSQTDAGKTINGFQDNGTYTNLSTGWVATGGGDGMECAVDYQNAAYTYHTIYFGDIFRRFNNENELRIAGNGAFGINESGAWVTPFILSENDPKRMFVGYKNIWKCNDVRASSPVWTKISNGETADCIVLEQSPANVDILYVVRWGSMVRTDNANADSPGWTSCTLPGGNTPSDLEAHPDNPDIVYATAGNNVYKSLNRGVNWTMVPGALPGVPVNTIVFDKNSNEGLYIGTQTGVLYKNPELNDWIIFNNGLPVVDVRELEIYYDAINPENNRLMAATYGRGLWKSDLIETGPLNPSGLTANTVSNVQINLAWNKNTSNDDVMVAWSPVASFGTPQNGQTYTAGSSIQGGGTVLYAGSGTSFNHLSLSQGTTYYYRAWSYDPAHKYSIGASAHSTTLSAPLADFVSDNYTPAVSEVVTFTDISCFLPTGWSWTFSPSTITFVNGTNAGSQNPEVVFSEPGQYSVTLTATNNYGINTKIKTNFISVIPVSYCIPASIYGTGWGDYISHVQLGDIDNQTVGLESPYYTYYSSMTTGLTVGSVNTISLSAGTEDPSYIAVWIDYNRDGIFDSAEKLGNIYVPPFPSSETILFTVPGNALTGITRMRVREVWDVSDFDACSDQYYGETEDYNVIILSTDKSLQLTLLLEGLYNGTSLNKAQNASGNQYEGTVADQVTIGLRHPSPPYANAAGPYTVNLNTDGTALLEVPSSINQSYYIVVNHRNSIETWSGSPVSFSQPAIAYNFTSTAGQAFGSNLKWASGKYLIYGGDVNQDGAVDTADMTPVDNDASGFATGYLATDVNGDGTVDTGDMTIIDNNAAAFVSSITP
ncbi:MAG: GEVED domain-containing protein [Lentimicrobium sp.]|nr:GEVED domain-containing protein [Lentimicrobium sp.]MEA5109266.1 GEVED domain-containing protein [Lentimicrobium sp.]